MIDYSDIKKGTKILLNGQPYEIVECAPLFKGRGHSVLPSKIKNLVTGEVISQTFRPSDNFEEPEVESKDLKFIYSHRENYVFCKKDDPGQRYELLKESIGSKADFLKEEQEVSGLFFEGKLIAVSLPIKIILKIKETPPSIKGQSAQAGTKPAILETGAKINVPLFLEQGDEVEINTETGEYVRRIS